ncbi:MAG: hypothetical protein ACRECH_12455, partial [Nitrososphaerales archaeon]
MSLISQSSVTTVNHTKSNSAVADTFMRKAFYAQGLWWVVYTDGVNMVYSTSSDGLTWSSPILFLSGANNGRDLSVYATDQYVYYVT